MLIKELVQTAARANDYLDDEARRKTIAYIRSRWNPDGGVSGRKNESDLYYTAYAAMGMRALKGPIPRWRLWNYLRSFGDGSSLGLIHLFCLVRLRSIYPITRRMRAKLMKSIESKRVDSASDIFVKVMMAEYLRESDRPEADLSVRAADNTSDIAAAVLVNQRPDPELHRYLMSRYLETGGFSPTPSELLSTIEATAKALFALRILNADLSKIRAPCLHFIESLRQEDGGYFAHANDDATDVASTLYALFSIGCLTGFASGNK